MENQIKTFNDFDVILNQCEEIRKKKRKDYGDSWKIFRPSSITDQIYIKAARIRSVQEKKENRVGEPLKDEFTGMINYSLMALFQLDRREKEITDDERFEKIISEIKILLDKKNHDYGEAWRNLRISSMVDLILAKLIRLKQIESNNYNVQVSEEAFASYQDVINYCVFCLILIREGTDPMI